MAFLDEIGKKMSEAGQKTIQKTKDYSETARLNSLLAEEESKLKDTYCQIGMKYLSLHGDAPDPEIAGLAEIIKGCEVRIQNYRAQIQNIRGVVTCPRCGAELAQGAVFCSACGAQLPREDDGMVQCPTCGRSLKRGTSFCTGCGTPLGGAPSLNINLSGGGDR